MSRGDGRVRATRRTISARMVSRYGFAQRRCAQRREGLPFVRENAAHGSESSGVTRNINRCNGHQGRAAPADADTLDQESHRAGESDSSRMSSRSVRQLYLTVSLGPEGADTSHPRARWNARALSHDTGHVRPNNVLTSIRSSHAERREHS